MKVGIDCRMYGLQYAGIGRYVENLVEELSKTKKQDFELVLFVRNKKQFQFQQFERLNNFNIFIADFPHYSLKEQIFLPFILSQAKCDLIHFPHFNIPIFYKGKCVVMIHDLIKHVSKGKETTTKNPALYWLKYWGYKFVFWSATRKAKKILVPCQWVKKQLVKTYRIDPEKVIVTYEGAGENFKTKNQKSKTKNTNLKILKKYKISKPFIVYTGSLYPHKNIEQLVKAMKQVNVLLVIVSARNAFSEKLKEKIKKLNAEKFVKMAGFVPDEDLVRLYHEAAVFVHPSLIEGFNLTVVEAMAVGLPSVVSDIPVHREIFNEAVLYFDPKSVDDMVDKIKIILKDQPLRDKLRKLGLKQAKKYSWQKMAWQTLKTYRSLMVSN